MFEREMWNYRTADESRSAVDVTGFGVEAIDGSIGKVDAASYETDSSLIVVDTGTWIFGKKVMLPAGVVDRIDYDDEKVYVHRTKDEIKHAPEYDDSLVGRHVLPRPARDVLRPGGRRLPRGRDARPPALAALAATKRGRRPGPPPSRLVLGSGLGRRGEGLLVDRLRPAGRRRCRRAGTRAPRSSRRRSATRRRSRRSRRGPCRCRRSRRSAAGPSRRTGRAPRSGGGRARAARGTPTRLA